MHRLQYLGFSLMGIPVIALLGLMVALAALATCLVWVVRVVSRMIDDIQPRDTPLPAVQKYDDAWIQDEFDRLSARINDLFRAVADGIDHVDRNEKRVRGIVVGAKRRFEAEGYSDPGVDAEADSLPQLDAVGGPEEGVLPLQEDMGRSPWAGVPGRLDGAS